MSCTKSRHGTSPPGAFCLSRRNVEGTPGAWAFGKEFVSILRQHRLPMMEGRAGAVFSICWGEVSDDGDGPVEWCRPVRSDQAEQFAVEVPELVLRTEPAHREAFIQFGPGGQAELAQWQLISVAARLAGNARGAAA